MIDSQTINVDELLSHTNAQLQKEERMYFCRDAAIRIKCALIGTGKSFLYVSPAQAWKEAEALWNAKPEHL